MPQQKLSDFKVDHRVITVTPTPAMQVIADEIAALQVKYRELEEVEQRRQFHAFKQLIRTRTEDRVHNELHAVFEGVLA